MTSPQTAAELGRRGRLTALGRVLRTFAFFVYYFAIIILLLWIYGRGDTPTAPFVYQGF
jgi:hypothetical protein